MVRYLLSAIYHCNLRLMPYNSFSDRDLLMRYHWGMGVGHIHAHGLAEVESLPLVNDLLADVEVEPETEPNTSMCPCAAIAYLCRTNVDRIVHQKSVKFWVRQ